MSWIGQAADPRDVRESELVLSVQAWQSDRSVATPSAAAADPDVHPADARGRKSGAVFWAPRRASCISVTNRLGGAGNVFRRQ